MPYDHAAKPYTPVPNWLIDEAMPMLSDTEWRVLCVIVRATLGWQGEEAGRRKGRDWLTQRQLKARTGRASEAVSRAIDGLVRRGLVETCDEKGRPLPTPQERRRCRGRIEFLLAKPALTPSVALPGSQDAVAAGVPGEAPEVAADRSYSLSEDGCSESELRKPNTTKESLYKKRGYAGQTTQGWHRPGETREPDSPAADVGRFLAAYQAQFRQRSARGEPPPILRERDGRLVGRLLQQYGYGRLTELLALFFRSDDPWVRKRGYALYCFPAILPQLLMGQGAQAKRSPYSRAAQAVQAQDTGRPWQRAAEAVSTSSLFERYPDLAARVRRGSLQSSTRPVGKPP